MGSRVAVKRAGVERREAYWSAAARDCGKARGKITAMRQRETNVCSRNASMHHGGKHLSGLEVSVCEGGAVCACRDRTDAHVEHGERRSARSVVERVSVQALLARFCEKGRALGVFVNGKHWL